MIKDSQLQFGLRHGDYLRYRQYCARRLRRLRKSVRFLHGRNFRQKVLDAKRTTSDRHLAIPLLNAERAWSYAMQLKNDLAKADDSRKQHHLLKRFKRATKWARQLQDLSTQVADTRTQLEAQAYAAWIAGAEAMERSDWQTALTEHLGSKMLYEALAKVSDFETEERCREMAAQMTATLRICKYQVKRADKAAFDKVVAANSKLNPETAEKFASLASEAKLRTSSSATFTVTFQGRRIPVANAKMRAALVSAASKEGKLPEITDADARVAMLTDIVRDYTLAFRLCTNDLNANQSAKARTVALDKQGAYLEALKTYLTAVKAKVKLQRNVVQAELIKARYDQNQTSTKKKKKSKGQSAEAGLVSAYDRVLASLNEVSQTSTRSDGDPQDENQDIDEDAKTEAAAAARERQVQTMLYRALRCSALAASATSRAKYRDSYFLLKRARTLAERARRDGSTDGSSAAADLLKATRARLIEAQARTLLAKANAESNLSISVKDMKLVASTQPPLLQRLDKFAAKTDAKLADFPVSLRSAPAKPVFFDVAYHSVQFGSLDKRVEEEKAKSGGLLSSLGSWLTG